MSLETELAKILKVEIKCEQTYLLASTLIHQLKQISVDLREVIVHPKEVCEFKQSDDADRHDPERPHEL